MLLRLYINYTGISFIPHYQYKQEVCDEIKCLLSEPTLRSQDPVKLSRHWELLIVCPHPAKLDSHKHCCSRDKIS